MNKIYISAASFAGFVFLFWLFCLNHVSVNAIGITCNSVNGDIKIQSKPGWYVTSPFVREIELQTTPIRVEILSDAKVINARMVRFKPEGAGDFIKLQGFSYSDSLFFESLLRGYAFSGKTYSFLEIIE